MKIHRYSEVDVFSPLAYQGNPLAVVHDADELSTEQMQRFAKWTNLAETTFLLTPTNPLADYRVRIFSATQEFPFAGHPTLGTAFSWLDRGGKAKNEHEVIQECGAGLINVRVDDQSLAFKAPPLTRYEPVAEAQIHEIAVALGITRETILDCSWLVNGPEWIGVKLANAQEVLALRPDPANLGTFCVGVIGEHSPGHDARFEVRAFLGDDPVWEDPVTGSLNAGLARWIFDTTNIDRHYTAAQGTVIGYHGRVHITADGDDIWVGGNVSSCVRGEVSL
ncbi:phenazine biosynthesis protein PhzF [Arthrobacter sp. MYb227]|uniref:PhzF family phenazine biosynthesis protein n=1 Tax=Arthrobacter sp. MYb227 TaxID=1848601 RepID=UPI000CFD598E|nr:PhzF family phenazine biosynthesis protein [Arthrobacter sp. MYb227]PQZ95059.1 phenazine biosynthesis protein PhzF [Arthrobacter sp. MYb227]